MLALGTQLLAGLLLALWNLFAPGMTADYGQLLEGAGVMETNALSVLATVALGPLWEDLVFRGLMMEYLRRAGADLWKANMIQALLFGLLCGPYWQSVIPQKPSERPGASSPDSRKNTGAARAHRRSGSHPSFCIPPEPPSGRSS